MITFYDKVVELMLAAKTFQAMRHQIGRGRYQTRLEEKAETHTGNIQALIAEINSDISLMESIQRQKRGKTKQRNKGYQRHEQTDIFRDARPDHASQQDQTEGDVK